MRRILLRIVTRVKVDPITGCWLWQGAFSQSGWRGVFYPVLRLGSRPGRLWRLNRLVLILCTDACDQPKLPTESIATWLWRLNLARRHQESAHTCDDARCIYPNHLKWSGHGANIQEQVDRRKSALEAVA